jgi:hypothetical protein
MIDAIKFTEAKNFWSKGQNTKAVKYLIGELALEVKTDLVGTFASFAIKEQADAAQKILEDAGWNVDRAGEFYFCCGMD